MNESVYIAALAISVLGLLGGGWWAIKTLQQLQQRLELRSSDLERLDKNLQMLNSVSIGMGQRLLALEQKLLQIKQQAPQVDVQPHDVSYTQAMQMFDRGFDAATVATSCSISRSEAQLMALIRQQAQQPAPLVD
jgi:hypothetical protein